jgi:hypothetical protein
MTKENSDEGKLFRVYDHIILFQPSHSRKSMKKVIFKKLDEGDFP